MYTRYIMFHYTLSCLNTLLHIRRFSMVNKQNTNVYTLCVYMYEVVRLVMRPVCSGRSR